jgi:predicted transcriptional regulator
VVRREIEVGAYLEADWDRFGFYDDGGVYEHQYAGDSHGYLSYGFAGVDGQVSQLTVEARLSAESNDRGASHETTDITLVLNGVELGTQTVIADDGRGQRYTWSVDDPQTIARLDLRPDQSNELRFVVKPDAANQRGLCVYGRAIDYSSSDQGMPVTVSLVR